MPEKAIARSEWRATCPLSSAQQNPKNAFSKEALFGLAMRDTPSANTNRKTLEEYERFAE
jgi:hypothetical protein